LEGLGYSPKIEVLHISQGRGLTKPSDSASSSSCLTWTEAAERFSASFFAATTAIFRVSASSETSLRSSSEIRSTRDWLRYSVVDLTRCRFINDRTVFAQAIGG
jgi:hypothetical protein